MNERVSVSMVTWNHAQWVEPCIQSLLRQTHAPCRIIVADNGSTDRTLHVLEKYVDRITIRRNGRNLGFCGGHNANLRESTGDYVLLANPDAIFQPDYLEAALRAFRKDPLIGTVCGVLYREGRILDGAGLSIGRNRRFTLIGNGKTDDILPKQDFEVFGADGAAPMYRRTLIDDLTIDRQFFDEMFFAHKEDHDVSWRARLRGWKTVCAPGCKAIHPRNFRPNDLDRRREIPPVVRYHSVKNFFLALIKNDDPLSLLRDLPWWLPRQAAILVYILLFERESLAAYRFILEHAREILASRRRIDGMRKLSRREMSAWLGRALP